MLTMKEKVFIGIIIILAAVVAANVIIPPGKTFQVKLVLSPAKDSIYAPARAPLDITCQGLGGDDKKFSSMKWLNREGNVISEGDSFVQKDGKRSLKLSFTNPKIEDSGIYKCVAVYDNIHTLEKAIKITFYGSKPTFERSYENITAEERSYLKVNCSAVGDKPMDYEWYKNEDKISEDTKSSIFVSNSENQSTLTIQKVDKIHGGMYTCLAKNVHGLSNKIYQITVQPPSGNETDNTSSISSIEVRNITSNSVRFFIDVSGSAKSIQVKYREFYIGTLNTTEWIYGDIYEIKDLVPGGKYRFQFRTVPSNHSKWSKIYEVVLLPDTPELIFHRLEGESVKLQWSLKKDSSWRAVDSYELKYFKVLKDKENMWVPINCTITITLPSCTGTSYTISGLFRNTYYEIQMRAHTESGYGESYKQKIYVSQ